MFVYYYMYSEESLQPTQPEDVPLAEIAEYIRPSKRARPDEVMNGNSDICQDNENIGPQEQGKGKKRLGRPQKGCEECKR